MCEKLTIERIETRVIDSEILEDSVTCLFISYRMSSREVVADNLYIAIRDAWSPTRALGDGLDRIS